MTRSARGAGRVRLLPVLIVALAALGLLKIASLVMIGGYSFLAITPATAQDPAAVAEDSSDPQGVAAQGPSATAATEGGAAAAGSTPEGERRIDLSAAQQTISDSELEVLKSLRARREEIDEREKSLAIRKRLLEAVEQRLEERIAELKAIQSRVEERFRATDDLEEKRLADLVKMYETMKPKKAARIFDRLDLRVLIGVAERMSPSILAEIIAAMDPAVAERVTIELADMPGLQPGPPLDDLAPVVPQ